MTRTILAAALAVAFMMPRVAAAQTASVYAVHGIPGQVLGPNVDASLPVDVSVQNGPCIAALAGFTFGEIRGPLALQPGTYTLEIRPANALHPCGNPPVLTSAALTLQAGTSYSVVAHLTEAGAPAVTPYVNDVSRTEPGMARVQVHHDAQAPAVNITIKRGSGNGPSARVPALANPSWAVAQVRPGEYQLSIAAAAAPDAPVFTGAVSFAPYTTTLVYAIGSLAYDGTFQLASKVVPAR